MMENRPTVSVIIPVFNREKLVRRTLDSIVAQEYRPLEIIVVDNNSSDGSLNVINDWMGEKNREDDKQLSLKLFEEKKKGASAARNTGFRNSRGEYVIFFDSDDTMRQGLIEAAVKEMQSDSCPDMVCWKSELHLLDGSTKVPPFMWHKPMEGHLIHALLRTQGFMSKRDLIEKTGGWNEKITAWVDWEFGLRLLLVNPKLTGLDSVFVDIYSQKDSITGETFSEKEGVWENAIETVRKKVKQSEYPSKEKILDILTYREIILAAHYSMEGNKKGAKELKDKSLKGVGLKKGFIMRFAYHYTRHGGRGAWRIVRLFL